MRLERVLAVAGVDALGRVAEVEVARRSFSPETLLEDRPADLLGDARVDGGLVDDDRALGLRGLRPADGLGGAFTTGVRSGPVLVDGRRHGDDEERCMPSSVRGVARHLQRRSS